MFDAITVMLVVLAALFGWMRGGRKAAVALLAAVLGFVAAWLFPQLFAGILRGRVAALWVRLLSPLLLFTAVFVGISLLASLIRRLTAKPAPRPAGDTSDPYEAPKVYYLRPEDSPDSQGPNQAPPSKLRPLGAAIYGLVGAFYALALGFMLEIQSVYPNLNAAARNSAIYGSLVSPWLEEAPLPAAVAPIQLAKYVSQHPKSIEKIRDRQELKELAEHPKVRAVADDPALRQAAENKDFEAILADPKIQALLDDEAFVEALLKIDAAEILRELKQAEQGQTPPR